MRQDEIIRMAREAGLAYGSDEKSLTSVIRFAALVAYAIEHGGSISDFLTELELQVREQERNACAAMVDPVDESLADEIRARGEK